MPPAINPESIATLRAISPEDPAFLRELIDVFLQDSPLRLTELEQALSAGNPTAVTRAGHTLKGSAGYFGATELAARAAEIERLGRTNALTDATALLPALREEYERVASELRLHR